jgi:hypothetical protein
LNSGLSFSSIPQMLILGEYRATSFRMLCSMAKAWLGLPYLVDGPVHVALDIVL